MMTLIQRYALTAASLLLAACSMVSVTTDYDHSVTFSRYRTYTLSSAPGDMALSPSSDLALRETLKARLQVHGLREVPEQADLNVVSHVFTKEKINVSPSAGWGYGGVPYRYGRYGMWGGAPMAYSDVTQYTDGTLILDFVDAKTQKLVFRGVATGTVGDPEANASRIQEAVEKIVLAFPRGAAN